MIKSVLRKSKAFYRINPTFNACPSCKNSGTIMHSTAETLKKNLLASFCFINTIDAKNAAGGVC